jgi:hypothetical protein
MSAYTDKLQEWVDSVKMCEAEGIEPCYKYKGSFIYTGWPYIADLKRYPDRYTFPIAVVEGKPVFDNDELYDGCGGKLIVRRHMNLDLAKWSWNPPKPSTVMVEMLVEDAELLVMPDEIGCPDWHNRLSRACRKALDEIT